MSIGYFHSFMNIPNVVDKWHELYDKYIFLCFKFYDKLNANEDAYRVRLMRTRWYCEAMKNEEIRVLTAKVKRFDLREIQYTVESDQFVIYFSSRFEFSVWSSLCSFYFSTFYDILLDRKRPTRNSRWRFGLKIKVSAHVCDV